MRKLRVLVLMHDYLVPPDDVSGHDLATAQWRTEYDVLKTLRDDLEHDVHVLGVKDDLAAIRQANDEFKPHIAFNLLEAFHEVGTFDQNVCRYLELLRLSYTGCNPRGMFLARDKALSKKLLHYHRIPVPEFTVVPRGRKPQLPKRLSFPVIVKSLTQESSIGISQASVVDDEAKLRERVQFIHESITTDAIVEQFVEGRELYCGVIGNQRLQVLPVWEMTFAKMPEGQHRIATERVKWSAKYQEKMGVATGEATTARRRRGRAGAAHHPARLQGARAERLRPHRPAARRRRAGLRPRGESESADRADRRLRRVSGDGRAALSRAAPADPDDRPALGTRAARLSRRLSTGLPSPHRIVCQTARPA